MAALLVFVRLHPETQKAIQSLSDDLDGRDSEAPALENTSHRLTDLRQQVALPPYARLWPICRATLDG